MVSGLFILNVVNAKRTLRVVEAGDIRYRVPITLRVAGLLHSKLL